MHRNFSVVREKSRKGHERSWKSYRKVMERSWKGKGKIWDRFGKCQGRWKSKKVVTLSKLNEKLAKQPRCRFTYMIWGFTFHTYSNFQRHLKCRAPAFEHDTCSQLWVSFSNTYVAHASAEGGGFSPCIFLEDFCLPGRWWRILKIMVAIENINAYITCLILKTSCTKEVRGAPFALLFKRTPKMWTTFCLTVPVVKKICRIHVQTRFWEV